MTKAQAAAHARQARRYGFHDHGLTAEYRYSVTCPVCRQRVATNRNYRWRPARRGEPWSREIDGKRSVYEQESVIQALDREVIDHLMNWCPGSPA